MEDMTEELPGQVMDGIADAAEPESSAADVEPADVELVLTATA